MCSSDLEDDRIESANSERAFLGVFMLLHILVVKLAFAIHMLDLGINEFRAILRQEKEFF